MKGYKAFNKGLVCKGKQYAENTVFCEEKAEICKCGMHFCENPFEVLSYYPLVDEHGEFSDFAEVDALAETKTADGKQFCTTKLRIDAKLSFAEFVKACVDFCLNKTVGDMSDSKMDSDDYSQLVSSGYGSQLASSGNWSQLASSGEDSVICAGGKDSIAKAKKGSWITLAEWAYSEDKERYVPVCVKTEYVDGERIKEDTFYQLKSGEFMEVDKK